MPMAKTNLIIDRRQAMTLVGVSLTTPAWMMAGSVQAQPFRSYGELVAKEPLPANIKIREGLVDVPGARLFYRDSGGTGQPILLAHPGTGSALIWAYQEAALINAGYRVISWSRRGHYGTIATQDQNGGSVSDDIDRLADVLGVDRFHALGSAAGGGFMLDYAVARPQRIRTLTIACSIGNIADPTYSARSAALRPAPFDKLPAEVRELGPCYRAANPEGVAAWLALEKKARTSAMGPPPVAGQRGGPRTQWSDVSALVMPILWMTGDADLFTPPPLLAEFHARTKGSEMAIIQGAGHSAYWEQPSAFNTTLIDFLRRRGG